MRVALPISVTTARFFAGVVVLGAALAQSGDLASTKSKTVMATFHVVAGKEPDFENVLVREWAVYTKERLVLDQPNIIVRGKEADGKTYFVHMFTWIDHATSEHPPTSVIAVWQKMEPLIEARNGHLSMEIADVQLVAPKH